MSGHELATKQLANVIFMIDIHNHLLPGVDDGADSLSTSLAMIRAGIEEGIEEAVITPHLSADNLTEKISSHYRERFEELLHGVQQEGLPIRLHLGSEIMFQFGLQNIRQLPVATFGGNGRYFLIEVPLTMFPSSLENALFRVRGSGLQPIFAHPERNIVIQRNPSIIDRLIEQGILMQIDATSLTGKPDRPTTRLARQLIVTGRAHFVATDAHDLSARPFKLQAAYEIVREITDDETVRRLFIDHPRCAIAGEKIDYSLPVEPFTPKHRGFLTRLLKL